jgi:heme-degrading monooxygenase HmoA
MTETYSSGVWMVKPGHEDDFIAAWREFVGWGTEMPGSGTFRLVRDLEHPNRFMSFGLWESAEAQQAWREHPEMAERLGRVRAHCEDVETYAYELASDVS